jgi:prophage regulatory protein
MTMKYHLQSNFDDLPDSALIRLKYLIGKGLNPGSPSTVWRQVKRGQFPAPIKISDNITAWQAGDIRRWQSKCLATQNASASSRGDA